MPVPLSRSLPLSLCVSDRLLLPGVGTFDASMSMLNRSGLRPSLESAVLERRVPILGICVGMQIMFDSSDEGSSNGLGWIPGRAIRFTADQPNAFLPHMGWNNMMPVNPHPLFHGIENSKSFYFLHSYYCLPVDPSNILCSSSYHIDFASGIFKDNIFGIQFHPEKSHCQGVSLLRNFSVI